MAVEGLTFIKENLEEIGFDLSNSSYDELIKESYINEVVASNIGEVKDVTNISCLDKNARQGFLIVYLNLIKVVPKGLYIYSYYIPEDIVEPENRDDIRDSSIYNVEGFPIFDNMLDVIKECYKFRFEVEESCVHIEHIHNCIRMLLTLFFFYDEIPIDDV
tara:strand:+ start:121 stop:603 length:483 start_codon:yes stop_codon:yes gene_type:complete